MTEVQETVVNEPVDAAQDVQPELPEAPQEAQQPEQTEQTEVPTPQTEPVVKEEVDAPKSEKPENMGEIITREAERRAAKVREEYEKKLEEIRRENEYLDKIARLNGFRDRHEYKKWVDEQEHRERIEREALKLGIDPDAYMQHFEPVAKEVEELKKKLATYEEKLTEKEMQERNQQLWGELYEAYPHLLEDAKAWEKGETPSFYTEKMQKYLEKGYDPIDAYELAHKDTLFKAKEQEVLARVTGRDQKQVLPSNDQPNNIQFDPANMSFDEILQISERVQRGERITF